MARNDYRRGFRAPRGLGQTLGGGRSMSRRTLVTILAGALSLTALPAQAAYPGANGDLYFASRRGTTHLCIWSVNVNDGATVKMTAGVNSSKEDWTPYWSPDGSKLLFQSDRDG